MDIEISSFRRGHAIKARKDSKGVYSIWEYLDGTPIKHNERSCIRCNKANTKKGHDSCLSNLPNVKYACCGHGVEDGYVTLDNGKYFRFNTDYSRKKIIQLIKKFK